MVAGRATHDKALDDGPPRMGAMIVSFARTLLVALCSYLVFAPLVCAHAQRLQLRLLETADVHMHLLDHDYARDTSTPQFGLARTAHLIAQARAEQPNHLLFDNGDLLQGSPLGDYSASARVAAGGLVHPAYRVLNALKVDAANLGNHEFDFGLPFLRGALKGAAFPVLSANLLDAESGRPAFAPVALLQRTWTDGTGQAHHLRIGVLGLAPPRSVAVLREQILGRLRVQDAVDSAARWVRHLRRRGADLVIVLAHSGLETASARRPMDDNVAAALARLPGVDALLLGHAHAEFPGPDFANTPGVDLQRGTLWGVPAVMPGRWGDHLGVIDLTLERQRRGTWRVVASQSSLRPIWDRTTGRARVEPAAWVSHLIDSEHQATRAWMQQPLAHSAQPLHCHFAQVEDAAALQLLNVAQLDYLAEQVRGTPWANLPRLSAAAPFKAGFGPGPAADIPAGPLTLKDAVEIYPYQNQFKAVRVNGAQLREWLEMSAGQFQTLDPVAGGTQPLLNPDFPSYNFDVIDGVRYAFDLTQAPRYTVQGRLNPQGGRRVALLEYQGQPVRNEQDFLVATHSYRAEGGGRFAALEKAEIVVDSRTDSRQVLVDYLRRAERVDTPPDQNWWIQAVPGVRPQFKAADAGLKHLRESRRLQAIGTPEDGRQIYELVAP